MVKLRSGGPTLTGFMAPGMLGGERLRRLVTQAIDREAPRVAQRDDILRAALEAAGHDDVPDDAAAFTVFVLGALHDEVGQALGDEAAHAVVISLRPWLERKTAAAFDEPPTVAETEDAPTVLVVDDDIAVRSGLVQMLRGLGYNAVSAPDGNVALAMCVRYRPRVVISELAIGEARGKQLAALLRVAFGEQAPPLVMMTSEPDSAADLNGTLPVLAKPVRADDLAAALAGLVGAPPA